MSEGPVAGWLLAAVLVVLILVAVGGSRLGHLGLERSLLTAAGRSVVQLLVVSAIIALILDRPWAAALFGAVMFATATFTAAGRDDAKSDWPWVALAIAAGVVPVLAIIFGSGVAPLTGPAIIPIAGIIIGGSMMAHTLTARRAFDSLRSEVGLVEAGLALGMPRPAAIAKVIGRHAPEALAPAIDQTRTVGLVTLPGAFVGVLLGGGSAAQAAAAQVLVLVGLLAAETLVVIGSQSLIARGLIMPTDVRSLLPPD